MRPLQNCIGPTIRIGREILCLPYAGFFSNVLYSLQGHTNFISLGQFFIINLICEKTYKLGSDYDKIPHSHQPMRRK